MKSITYIIILLVNILFLAGCGTKDRDIETPIGSRPGDQFGGFEIIGISSKTSATGNLNDAHTQFNEKLTINVPVGTFIIIPAVRGWLTGFGTINPSDLSNINDLNGTIKWNSDDHHLGIQSFNVYVDHISAADTVANTQSAVIGFSGILSDYNSDDKWFGIINYDLIFLGKK